MFEHLSQLLPCLGIRHLYLSHHFAKRLALGQVLRRVVLRVGADVLQLPLFKKHRVFDFLLILTLIALQLIHVVHPLRSILDLVQKPHLFQAIPLIGSVLLQLLEQNARVDRLARARCSFKCSHLRHDLLVGHHVWILELLNPALRLLVHHVEWLCWLLVVFGWEHHFTLWSFL